MSMPVYRIGAAAVSMVSLESIGVPLPKASPVDYAEYITLGDGSNRGVGWLCCEWRFAHLTLTQLAVLRGYCTAESAAGEFGGEELNRLDRRSERIASRSIEEVLR